jgi:hemolysin activation/secretion protein
MIKKALLLLIFILGLGGGNVLAAETDQTGSQPGNVGQSVENRDYFRLEKELQEQKTTREASNVTDKTTKQETTTPVAKAQIFVKKIVTDVSEILSDAEIAAVTAKYEGRSVDIQDLYRALQEINDLYTQKGFITAKAVLPPQKVTDGIVRVKLVEAHFGELLLEGNEHTRDAYILKRLSQQSGDLVNMSILEKDLFYFNRTNDIQLKAELKPGQAFGLTDCVLKVAEPSHSQATLFSDNEGSTNTGRYRLGLSWVDNSLTGNRDFLSISPVGTEGTLAGSVSYNRPVTGKGTSLGFSYSKNQSSVISGPFDSLDIQSDETDSGLNLNHPFQVKPNFKMDGIASLFHKKAQTDFSGATLIDYEVNTVSLGIALQNIDPAGFWYHRYELTRGDSDIGAAFYRFNLTAVRQQKIKKDGLLIYRVTGQLSNNHLLPSTEQFSIGGINTVRGYATGTLSGDQGYNLSIEYDFPIQSFHRTKGFGFIDHGGAFPFKGNNQGSSSEDYLTSIGFGFNLYNSKYLSGKLVVGMPIDPPQERCGLQIEFYLQSVFYQTGRREKDN